MKNNTLSMHGKSFLSALKGETNEHRKAIITGYHEGIDRCIRDREWSYIQRLEGEPDELYDLTRDPKEKVNLIDEHPEEAQRLSALFGQYYRRSGVRIIKGIQGRYEVSSGTLE